MRAFLKTLTCVAVLALAACSSSNSSGPISTDEKEPLDKGAAGAVLNDTPATAEAITVGPPLFGALADSSDVDFYKFHAKASQLLLADVYAVRLAPTVWSEAPTITLYDTDGATVLWTNSPSIMDWSGEDPGFAGVAIPADGDYYVALSATGEGDTVGAYGLRLALSSPAGSLQHEAEAADQTGLNNDYATAEAIVPGVMEGNYANEDDDWYKFSLDGTQRVVFTLTAFRNGYPADGIDQLDSELWLYSVAEGTTTDIIDNDDSWYYDSSVDATLPAGDYAVRVTKCCRTPGTVPYLLQFDRLALSPTAEAAGNSTRDAAMTIAYGKAYSGTFAAVDEHHFYKFTGKAGELVRLTGLDVQNMNQPIVTDADGVEIPGGTSDGGSSFIQTILQADGEYTVDVSAYAAGTFSFQLDRVAAAQEEVEPNDAAGQESAFTNDGWAAGALAATDDVDRFGFTAEATQLVTISLLADGGSGMDSYWGSSLDAPVLTVYDAAGEVVVQTDTSGDNLPVGVVRPTPELEASFRAPAKGAYTVAVSLGEGASLGDFPYYALKLNKNQ